MNATAVAEPCLTTPTGVLDTPPDLQSADRRAWLASRRRGIGSSDIAAICGLSPYSSALHVYLAKRGELPEADNPRLDEAAEIGLLMEPVIATLFERRSGIRVLPHPGTVAHRERRWMLASVDRLLADEAGIAAGILELKARSENQGSAWASVAPWDVVVQVQWQMAVTGYPWAYIAALIGGNRLVVHKVDSHPEVQDGLVDIGRRFWLDTLAGKEPPAAEGEAVRRLLTARHPRPGRGSVLMADPAVVRPLLETRAHAKRVLDEWGPVYERAGNRMRQLAGDHEIVMAEGEVAFTWKADSRGRRALSVPAAGGGA